MTISKQIAWEAAYFLRLHATPEAARHEVMTQIRALKPYYSRNLDSAAEVLRFICATPDTEKRAKRLAQLLTIAGTTEVAS